MPKTYRKTANKKEILIYRKEKIAEFEDIYESIKPNILSFTAKNIFCSILKHISYTVAGILIISGCLLLVPAEIHYRLDLSSENISIADFEEGAIVFKYLFWSAGLLFLFIARLLKNIQVKRFWITEQTELIEDILEFVKSEPAPETSA